MTLESQLSEKDAEIKRLKHKNFLLKMIKGKDNRFIQGQGKYVVTCGTLERCVALPSIRGLSATWDEGS